VRIADCAAGRNFAMNCRWNWRRLSIRVIEPVAAERAGNIPATELPQATKRFCAAWAVRGGLRWGNAPPVGRPVRVKGEVGGLAVRVGDWRSAGPGRDFSAAGDHAQLVQIQLARKVVCLCCQRRRRKVRSGAGSSCSTPKFHCCIYGHWA